MSLVRFLAGVGGAWLVALTMLSAVRVAVLPRSASTAISRAVFLTMRRLFLVVASDRRPFEFQDRILALYAPVSLVVLPLVWLALILAGFAGVFWATGYGSLSESIYVSGSAVTTLGSAQLSSTGHRLLAFAEAGMGLIVIALLITFLPTLYAAFARRETQVALLEVRAGAPPTALEMLQRINRIHGLQVLVHIFEEWEEWFAELEQTHTAFPALVFFRSTQAGQSWVTASGAVLDCAALYASTLDVAVAPQAGLTIRAGYIALRRLAAFFGADFDWDPAPSDPITIAREEYDQVYDALLEAGLPLRSTREQCWKDFAGWRVNYDTPLLHLAELVRAPLAPWTSDRSPLGRRPVRISRWGFQRDSTP
jgi:hypothetical protein